MSQTVLECLIDRLRQAAIYNRHDLAPPTVVLWPDGERHWNAAIPLLQQAMRELLVLNPEVSGEGQGPSTWLRYRLARGAFRHMPVIYLPGISRVSFRGAAGFPEAARHLFALQYQGQFWSQANGKDWTPAAFLASREGGLGLDLARDRATLDALGAQLTSVLRKPLSSFAGRRLEASDFHTLVGDPIDLLLEWMSQAGEVQALWPAEQWTGFLALCKSDFGLDPAKDGILEAAERFAAGSGAWDQAWHRYEQAPLAFAGLRKVLDLVQPKDLFLAASDRLPAHNRNEEQALRSGLLKLADRPRAEALTALARLCEQHIARAQSVWAALGEAPLARAAVHLKALAAGIQAGNLGCDWPTLAEAYARQGWTVDAAAWKAYAEVRDAPDSEAVAAALRAVYAPWLETLAQSVQSWWTSYPVTSPADVPVFEAEPGTVLVFVDGLRCDLGFELQRLLAGHSLESQLETRWSALPTVTATAKPAWQPLAGELRGGRLTGGFEPQWADTGKDLSTATFRNRLAKLGWVFLESGSTGNPEAPAWTEIGNFDSDGHSLGARLAWRIEEELRAVCLRVRELLNAGWTRAVVVTDHGWLLLPKGLPKAELPSHLTLSRWPRCAVPTPGAQHGFKETPWYWGGGHGVVLAPGIASFKAGVEYAHGGSSVQEALVPTLTVTTGDASGAAVEIVSVKWLGQRLKVQLKGGFEGTVLDIRSKAADAGSTLLGEGASPKPPTTEGAATLLVPSEDDAGHAALLVVIRNGQVVAKRSVTIGED